MPTKSEPCLWGDSTLKNKSSENNVACTWNPFFSKQQLTGFICSSYKTWRLAESWAVFLQRLNINLSLFLYTRHLYLKEFLAGWLTFIFDTNQKTFEVMFWLGPGKASVSNLKYVRRPRPSSNSTFLPFGLTSWCPASTASSIGLIINEDLGYHTDDLFGWQFFFSVKLLRTNFPIKREKRSRSMNGSKVKAQN